MEVGWRLGRSGGDGRGEGVGGVMCWGGGSGSINSDY